MVERIRAIGAAPEPRAIEPFAIALPLGEVTPEKTPVVAPLDFLADEPETPPKPTFEDLPGRIRAARQTAKELNTVTDALNREISEIESALVALHFGVQAWVDLADTDGNEDVRSWLSFRKHHGEWGIFVEDEHPDDPTDITRVPIAKTSRSVRIQAAGLLPELVNALIARMQAQVGEVREKTETLVTLKAKLRESQP